MAIERFIWTTHAEDRLDDRHLTRGEVERAIRNGHSERQINRGDADWRVHAYRSDGHRFAVLYDHPVHGNRATVRIVTVWPLRTRRRP